MERSVDTREAIDAVLRRKSEALVQKSVETLAEIIDPSFVYVSSTGRKADKAQYIARISEAADWSFGSQVIEDLDVRAYGDFAIETMTVHDTFLHPGGSRKRTFLSLCAFRKVGDAWLWAAGQTMSPEKPFS